MPHPARPSFRGRYSRALWVPVLVLAAVTTSACGDDQPTNPTNPTTPTAVTETFEGTVTVNGAITHPFVVQTAGTVVARIAALEPADAVIGLSIGTWNGVTCQIVLANDNARVYDVGKLSQATSYQITVTHF